MTSTQSGSLASSAAAWCGRRPRRRRREGVAAAVRGRRHRPALAAGSAVYQGTAYDKNPRNSGEVVRGQGGDQAARAALFEGKQGARGTRDGDSRSRSSGSSSHAEPDRYRAELLPMADAAADEKKGNPLQPDVTKALQEAFTVERPGDQFRVNVTMPEGFRHGGDEAAGHLLVLSAEFLGPGVVRTARLGCHKAQVPELSVRADGVFVRLGTRSWSRAPIVGPRGR